jgi:hypothetical protein
MGEDGKSGVPRWLVISTAVISLVAAILVAGAKYYEFHKARAEAAKATSGDDPPKRETPPPEKGAIPGSQPKPSEGGFTAGSVWDGYTDEPIGLKTRIVVDSCERGRFKGVMTPHQAGVEWYSAKITGTISADGEVEFKTRPEDQFTGQKKLIPCYFKGVVRGNEFRGRWTADGGPSASFVITRK